MKRAVIACSCALVLGAVVASATEQTGKRPPSTVSGAAQQGPGVGTLLAKPDFQAWPDGQWIFVVNFGALDYTGPVDVGATCKSTAPMAPPDACGPNFPNGNFHYHLANFPSGHGNFPIKGSGNAQQISGPGWRALPMTLPAGTFTITVNVDPQNKIVESNESNNTSTKTITIAPPPGPGGLKISPTAVIQTKS